MFRMDFVFDRKLIEHKSPLVYFVQKTSDVDQLLVYACLQCDL